MNADEDKIPYVFGDPWDSVYYHTISMLREMGMDDESIRTWFNEPNRYLYGDTSRYLIENGKFTDVFNAARALREGSFGLNPTDDQNKK